MIYYVTLKILYTNKFEVIEKLRHPRQWGAADMEEGVIARDSYAKLFIVVGLDGKRQVGLCTDWIECPYIIGDNGGMVLEMFLVTIIGSLDIQ